MRGQKYINNNNNNNNNNNTNKAYTLIQPICFPADYVLTRLDPRSRSVAVVFTRLKSEHSKSPERGQGFV